MRYLLVLACLVTPNAASANSTKATQLQARVENSQVVVDAIRNAPTAERREMLCLAFNLYHEARGSSTADLEAVGSVTQNRVRARGWARTICDVVWQQSRNAKGHMVGQFSWTTGSMQSLVPRELNAWERVQQIAVQLYRGILGDNTDGATHYYCPRSANPAWARLGVDKRRIGSHIYMKLPKGS